LRHGETNISFFVIAYICSIAQTGKNTDIAANLLSEGKLVAIPTETVYGLAANALDEKAVLSVFEAKRRPFFDPLIVHVSSLDSAKKYATFNDPRLLELANNFWPGPLTLLLPKKNNVPDLVTSGLPLVAVRVPNHALTLELLNKVGFPLAAPSANPFGYVSPTQAIHVANQLGAEVDYILDGGECSVGLESTIVGVEEGKICVFRLGGLAIEVIESFVGEVDLRINVSSNPKVPGQLKSHYAPRKSLKLGDLKTLALENAAKKIVAITFGNIDLPSGVIQLNLSSKSDINEAALNLFKFLREADESEADLVIASLLPDEGLGKAINDRLKRASA
jgi:L-threonylcarbamoyladenylate synthase